MVTAAVSREYEIYGTDYEGDLCLFPCDVSQYTFAQMTNYKSQIIRKDELYNAFPYSIYFKGSIIGIFSAGVAHAQSSKQVMFRSDDHGKTWSYRDFFINDTLAIDVSLISDLLADGDSIDLKVWNIRKSNGVITTNTNSVINVSGVNYAIWSRPKEKDNILYRTGYYYNAGSISGKTALFTSSDNGDTWTFKSIIAEQENKTFNEADIVNTTGSNWIAYIREDTGLYNNLYKAVSTDNGDTWSTPTVIDYKVMNGRQPNLTKLSDGSIVLATGDRSGTSGYAGSAGNVVFGTDTTGITIFRSTDNGETWSYRTRISPIYSTDGGQPFIVDLGSGNINAVWYARRTTKEKTAVMSCTMNVSDI